jgi:thiol-disulfide isomerase/thioredoxin/tetratricopeptide (TPR) repeat protein
VLERIECQDNTQLEHALSYERLAWYPKSESDFDRRNLPQVGWDEEHHTFTLTFDGKLAKKILSCPTPSLLIQRSAQKGATLIVELAGPNVVGEVFKEHGMLLIYDAVVLRLQLSELWTDRQYEDVRAFVAEARDIGIQLADLSRYDTQARLELQRRAGLWAFKNKNYRRAAHKLEEIAQRYPEDFEANMALARAYYHESNYGDASQILERLRIRAPRHGQVQYRLGLVEMARGNGQRATDLFRQATRKGFDNAHFYLGFAHFEQADYGEAHAALRYFLGLGLDSDLNGRAEKLLAAANRRLQPPIRPAARDPETPSRPPVQPTVVANAGKGRHTDPRNPEPEPPAPAETTSEDSEAQPPTSAYGHGIQLEGFNRDSVPLDSFRGKVVLLHLWASWCLPCLQEIPSLSRFHQESYPALTADGMELVTINMDYTLRDLERFAGKRLAEPESSFPIYWDPNWQLAERLEFGSVLPQTILIDSDGTIVATKVGEQDWQSPTFQRWVEKHLNTARP